MDSGIATSSNLGFHTSIWLIANRITCRHFCLYIPYINQADDLGDIRGLRWSGTGQFSRQEGKICIIHFVCCPWCPVSGDALLQIKKLCVLTLFWHFIAFTGFAICCMSSVWCTTVTSEKLICLHELIVFIYSILSGNDKKVIQEDLLCDRWWHPMHCNASL